MSFFLCTKLENDNLGIRKELLLMSYLSIGRILIATFLYGYGKIIPSSEWIIFIIGRTFWLFSDILLLYLISFYPKYSFRKYRSRSLLHSKSKSDTLTFMNSSASTLDILRQNSMKERESMRLDVSLMADYYKHENQATVNINLQHSSTPSQSMEISSVGGTSSAAVENANINIGMLESGDDDEDTNVNGVNSVNINKNKGEKEKEKEKERTGPKSRRVRSAWKLTVSSYEGYDRFMNHLAKEFSLETLLFVQEYVQIKLVLIEHFSIIMKQLSNESKFARYQLKLSPDVAQSLFAQRLNLKLLKLFQKESKLESKLQLKFKAKTNTNTNKDKEIKLQTKNINTNTIKTNDKKIYIKTIKNCKMICSEIIKTFRLMYYKYIDPKDALFMINIPGRQRRQLKRLLDHCTNKHSLSASASTIEFALESGSRLTSTINEDDHNRKSINIGNKCNYNCTCTCCCTCNNNSCCNRCGTVISAIISPKRVAKRSTSSKTLLFTSRLSANEIGEHNLQPAKINHDFEQYVDTLVHEMNKKNISANDNQENIKVNEKLAKWTLEQLIIPTEKCVLEVSKLLNEAFSRMM